MLSKNVILDAIDAVFPAIEVADSRYSNWKAAPASATVADLASAGAWVQGADCPRWREVDFSTLAVRLSADGEVVRSECGATVYGDPWHALALAIAALGSEGRKVCAGDVVSTGTCITPLVMSGPVALAADFGPLGQVKLDLMGSPKVHG